MVRDSDTTSDDASNNISVGEQNSTYLSREDKKCDSSQTCVKSSTPTSLAANDHDKLSANEQEELDNGKCVHVHGHDGNDLRRHSLPALGTTLPTPDPFVLVGRQNRDKSSDLKPDTRRQVFTRWREVEHLRNELLANHSEAIYAWRLFDQQQQIIQDNRVELLNATEELNRADINVDAVYDRLKKANAQLGEASKDLHLQQETLQELASARAKLDYDIAMEESALFYQLTLLIGHLPETGASVRLVKSQPTSNASDAAEDVPDLLRQYYDAFGWVGVLQERLQELQVDQLQAKHSTDVLQRLDSSSALPDSRSDEQFQKDQVDLERQLDEAQRRVDDFERQCTNNGIEMPVNLQSSGIEDEAGPGPRNGDNLNRFNALNRPRSAQKPRRSPSKKVKGSSARRRKATDLLTVHKSPITEAGSSINQWAQRVWHSTHSAGRRTSDGNLSSGRVSMRSTASLPEYVLVNTFLPEWRDSTESDRAQEAATRQKQASIGMSTIRTFTHKRAHHSDSSLLAHTRLPKLTSALRRATLQQLNGLAIARQKSSGRRNFDVESRRAKRANFKSTAKHALLSTFHFGD